MMFSKQPWRSLAKYLLLSTALLVGQTKAEDATTPTTPPPPYSASTTTLLQKIRSPFYWNLREHLFKIKTTTETVLSKLLPTDQKNSAYLYTQSEKPTCDFFTRENCMPSALKEAIEKNPMNSLYIGNLLEPLVLTTDLEKTHAQNAINALLRSRAPLHPIDFTKLYSNQALPLKFKDEPIKNYIASLRAYSSHLAFIVSNFLSFYEDRLPLQLNDTQKAAIKQLLEQETWFKEFDTQPYMVSRAKISYMSANRRLLDEQWARNAEQASATDLQRETNQLLAELLSKMEEMKQQNDTVIMALSSLLLESIDMQRTKISYDAQQIISPPKQ